MKKVLFTPTFTLVDLLIIRKLENTSSLFKNANKLGYLSVFEYLAVGIEIIKTIRNAIAKNGILNNPVLFIISMCQMHICRKKKMEGIHQNITCNYLLVSHLVYFYFIFDIIFQLLYDYSWGNVNYCLFTPDRAPDSRPKNYFSQA